MRQVFKLTLIFTLTFIKEQTMYRVVTPQSEAELEAYYQLRWQLLRKLAAA